MPQYSTWSFCVREVRIYRCSMYRCTDVEQKGWNSGSFFSSISGYTEDHHKNNRAEKRAFLVTANWKTQCFSAKNPVSVKILLESWRCCRDVTLSWVAIQDVWIPKVCILSPETFTVQEVRRKSLYLFLQGGRKFWGRWACHFLMETADWIPVTTCGCSPAGAPLDPASRASKQDLPFWEGTLEKHQAERT